MALDFVAIRKKVIFLTILSEHSREHGNKKRPQRTHVRLELGIALKFSIPNCVGELGELPLQTIGSSPSVHL